MTHKSYSSGFGSVPNSIPKDKNQTITDGLYILQGSLNRIANALEEVLRLVKEDQAKTAERYKEYDKEEN